MPENTNIMLPGSLDIFAKAPENLSHESSYIHSYDPVNAISTHTPIIFRVPATEEYVFLNETTLYLRVKIIKSNGEDMVAGDDAKVGPTNLLFGSIFKNAKLTLGSRGKEVTPSGENYPYKAYFDTLFGSKVDSGQTFPLTGWSPDSKKDYTACDNWKTLAEEYKRSNVVELVGRPYIDFLYQKKELINLVDMQFAFYPNRHEFCLMQAGNTNYKYEIMEAKLSLRKAKLSPVFQDAHNQAISTGNAKYDFQISGVKILQIPAGQNSFVRSDIFGSEIPNKTIITFVRNTAYSGTKELSPYWFEHNDVKSIQFFKNGVPCPHIRDIEMDFTTPNNKRVLETYHTLLDVTDRGVSTEDGIIYGPEMLTNGRFFKGFDFSNLKANSEFVTQNQYGTLDLHVKFRTPLPNEIEVLIYSFFDTRVEVTKGREILFTFNQ